MDRLKDDDISAIHGAPHRGVGSGPHGGIYVRGPGRQRRPAARRASPPSRLDYPSLVSHADGHTHPFSSNIGVHQQAVLKYRREIREQRRELEAEQGN